MSQGALNTLLPAFTVVVGKGAETGEREVHVEIVLEVQVYNGERLQDRREGSTLRPRKIAHVLERG